MKTRLLPLCAVLILTLLCGCSKNSKSTIVLIGEEREVVDFTEVGTDVLQKALLKYGYVTDTAQRLVLTTPPNVEGKYKVDRMFFLALEEVYNAGTEFETYMGDFIDVMNESSQESLVLELKNQNNRTVDMTYSWLVSDKVVYHYDMTANVVGAKYLDKNGEEVEIFALYFVCVKDYIDTSAGWDCQYHSGELITGRILPDGIADFKFSATCRDKWGADAGMLQRVGDFKVAEDYGNKHQTNYITPRID